MEEMGMSPMDALQDGAAAGVSEHALERVRRTGIVVDLSALDDVDALTVGALLRAQRRARAAGVRFAVAFDPRARPDIAELLRRSGADAVLPLFAAAADAVDWA